MNCTVVNGNCQFSSSPASMKRRTTKSLEYKGSTITSKVSRTVKKKGVQGKACKESPLVTDKRRRKADSDSNASRTKRRRVSSSPNTASLTCSRTLKVANGVVKTKSDNTLSVTLLLWAWKRSTFFSQLPVELIENVRTFLTARKPPSARNAVANPIYLLNFLGQEAGRLKADVLRTVCCGEVRFNKYSGILELKNALLLFINVNGPQFPNAFSVVRRPKSALNDPLCCSSSGSKEQLETGNDADDLRFRRLTSGDFLASVSFYAPNSAGPDHHLVTRISEDIASHVLLFCRDPGNPFFYFGRLKMTSVDLSVRPIRFDFVLLDSAFLARTSGYFRETMRTLPRKTPPSVVD
jgi:hypothetical protein